MRSILKIAAVAACTIATPTFAQDWSGPYIGISGGYTDASSDQVVALGGAWSTESTALQTAVTTGYATNSQVKDFNYGGQIGYNLQTASGLVVGVEADVSGLSSKDAQVNPITPLPGLTYTVSNTFDPKVTYGVKGKLGFASGDMLVYATGGWGWTQADLATDITATNGYHKASSFSHTFDGWEAGAGIEQRLGPKVSVRVDYTYADHGDVTYSTGYVTGSAFQSPAYRETYTQDLTMHLIRVGLNLHF